MFRWIKHAKSVTRSAVYCDKLVTDTPSLEISHGCIDMGHGSSDRPELSAFIGPKFVVIYDEASRYGLRPTCPKCEAKGFVGRKLILWKKFHMRRARFVYDIDWPFLVVPQEM